MIGDQIKRVREGKGYTLEELGKMVGKSKSTMSRIENREPYKVEPELLNEIADALGVSILFLMKSREVLRQNINRIKELKDGDVIEIIVEDDDMSPEIPEEAIMMVRALKPDEKLQPGSHYLIEFNNQRKFRLAIDDKDDGLGFLPMSKSEHRISYDKEYVNILGKATEMIVVFEDETEYE